MKTIFTITGMDILLAYNKLNENEITAPSDVDHFEQVFDEWVNKVRIVLWLQDPKRDVELSLNKINYLGKKTRALLLAIGMKETRTLKLLIERLRSIDSLPDEIIMNHCEDVTFKKQLETEDFVYYGNEEEGDDNANTMMFRKDGFQLLSNNYFASNDLFERLIERDWTWISDSAKYGADELAKENS